MNPRGGGGGGDTTKWLLMQLIKPHEASIRIRITDHRHNHSLDMPSSHTQWGTPPPTAVGHGNNGATGYVSLPHEKHLPAFTYSGRNDLPNVSKNP